MIGRAGGGRRGAAAVPDRGVLRRSMLALSIGVLAVLASACSLGFGGSNPPKFDPADADHPRHFMVLPINLTIRTPPEFEPVLDDMFGAIAGYIRGRGDTLETLSRKRATQGWVASIEEVKESNALEDNFNSAMRVYVARLAEDYSFDALIAPSMIYRATKVRERTAKWDGVFRKMKVINLSDVAKKKGLARSISVEISGVSLHVMVFRPDGELIFQQYGGLDLAHDIDMESAEFTMAPRLALKADLLKDSERIDEGIEEAFDPYLPKR
jgi:predicted DNA-binding ribbon-helix-helix protein